MSKKIISQKGLTVVELVVASGLLMAISLGVATFLPVGVKANDKNRKKMVSSNLFHEVMEEVQTLEFDDLNTGSEPAIPSGQDTVVILDTTQNNVQLDSTGLVSGDVLSFGSGTQAIQYPRHYRINNVDYRVDIKVNKGKYDHLVAYGSAGWGISDYLIPAAYAAQTPGTASISVSPGAEGYRNTTAFSFSANCDKCPPEKHRVYNWNFGIGEGANSSSIAPSHVFNNSGSNKKVFLSITDRRDPNKVVTAETYVNVKDSKVGINVTPSSPVAGETVTLVASCETATNSDCGDNPTYIWNFGDGTSATGQQVSHVYSEAGQYTPSVQVSGGADPLGTEPITVAPKNGKTAELTVSPSTTGIAGPSDNPDTTIFQLSPNANGYDDPAITSIQYEIDFGDGTNPVQVVDSAPHDGNAPSVAHVYTNGGSYNVQVTATPQGDSIGDEDNVSATTSTTITAKSVITLDASTSDTFVGQSVSFLAETQGAGTHPIYSWDFGDGTVVNGDYSGIGGHSYSEPGTYTVTVSAKGGTDPSTSHQVIVKSLAGNLGSQAIMKKVEVYITPWNDGSANLDAVVADGTFLKGDNQQ